MPSVNVWRTRLTRQAVSAHPTASTDVVNPSTTMMAVVETGIPVATYFNWVTGDAVAILVAILIASSNRMAAVS